MHYGFECWGNGSFGTHKTYFGLRGSHLHVGPSQPLECSKGPPLSLAQPLQYSQLLWMHCNYKDPISYKPIYDIHRYTSTRNVNKGVWIINRKIKDEKSWILKYGWQIMNDDLGTIHSTVADKIGNYANYVMHIYEYS